MARKKNLENTITLEYSGEPAEAIPIPNAPVEEPIVIAAEEVKEEPPPEPEVETVPEPEPETAPATPIPTNPAGVWDLEWELEIAHSQIQHCLDYTEIPGADYKGYFRGKLKEWRMYAYKVRQYSIHGGNVPQRPEPVEDKY